MSDQPENIDLAFIGRALSRLTAEVGTLRDDVNVLTSIVLRLDNSHGRLLDELRAIHAQQQRVDARLRAVEAKVQAK